MIKEVFFVSLLYCIVFSSNSMENGVVIKEWDPKPDLQYLFSIRDLEFRKFENSRIKTQEFLKDKTQEQKDAFALELHAEKYCDKRKYLRRTAILEEAILAGAHANAMKDGVPYEHYLYYPVLYNELSSVQFLLTHGANPNLPAADIYCPCKKIHLIFTARSYKVAKLLIDHGVQPKDLRKNIGTFGDKTFLAFPPNCIDNAISGDLEASLITLYAQHGVDVNGATSSSPLHKLASKECPCYFLLNLSCARVLLKYGACTDLKDKNDKTAFQLVYEKLSSSKTGEMTKIYLKKLGSLLIKDQTYFSMLPEEINEMIFDFAFGMG